jgi:osmoprotectant transport system substrate-binding protein
MKKSIVILLSLSLILLTACSSSGASSKQEQPKANIVVGGKVFTEQVLLVQIMGQLLQNKTNHDVSFKEGLGSSQVLIQALKDNDIQVFADYSGTGYINILKNQLQPDDTPDSVYQKAKEGYEKEFGFTWLKPLGFSNTFTLIVKSDKAKELNIKTFSDLVAHAPNLSLGSDAQFFERVDGYKGMADKYGFKFKKHVEMDIGLAYTALADNDIDVLVGYATDGRIPALNLTILKDDKGYFPPYYPAPILRMDFIEKYPDVVEVLNLLAGKLDEKTMAGLNAQVDVEKKDASAVAKEFLIQSGLISN